MATTESVPGKICKSVGAQFPAMALPAAPVMKNIADAAVERLRNGGRLRVQHVRLFGRQRQHDGGGGRRSQGGAAR